MSFIILYSLTEKTPTTITKFNEGFSLKSFKGFKYKILKNTNSQKNYQSITSILEKNNLSVIEKRILQMNILKNYFTKVDRINLVSHIHNPDINKFLRKSTENISKIKNQGTLSLEILIIQKNDKFDSLIIQSIGNEDLNKLIIENTLIQVNVFDSNTKNKIDEEII